MKKVGYLGAGLWGYCLATLLASKGHELIIWTLDAAFAAHMNGGGEHPHLKGVCNRPNMRLTTDMREALDGIEFLVEGVTSAGIRPVFTQVREVGVPDCPIVLTSKGIEQNSGMLLTEVLLEVLGEERRQQIACISGPSIAIEVAQGLPASVVSAAYSSEVMMAVQELFTTRSFRVYPNADINGVEFGGAMKNIIAIACGISDGLGFGDNTKAAIMTRGLHEIRKLAAVKGSDAATLNGLAGMGDLCVTCLSRHSRNYRFGRMLAEEKSPEQAKKEIGMVVEGAYCCVSALQLGQQYGIPLPISEAVYKIIYEGMRPSEAVQYLMERAIKEEHL
jgi:glycerol-3-phosphate dehydrogenase (NAD(P)+)